MRPKKLATADDIRTLIDGRIARDGDGGFEACRVSTPRALPPASHRYHGSNWIIDRIEHFKPGCESVVRRVVAMTMYEYDCSDFALTAKVAERA